MPAGPEPTIAIFLPVLCVGTCGLTQDFSQARSIMACSIDLIPTAESLIPSVQAASHGAGQIRPVNSGKLLVECKTSLACCQSLSYTKLLKSGMILLTGQPLLQNGIPQSMQRALCVLASSSVSTATNSL